MGRVLIGNIKGPKGDTGPTGIRGPVGPTGPPGPAGSVNESSVVAFEEAAIRENINSKESLTVLFAKIKKWFTDFSVVAFSGNYNDLSNKPSVPAAVTVKGNAETNYRTGNVNLTPANIGAIAESKIVKSTNITQEGFLMDGKTASDALAQLNSKLIIGFESMTGVHEAVANSTAKTIIIEKVGNVVDINVNVRLASAVSAYQVFFTLPVGYRPKITKYARVGTHPTVSINAETGKVQAQGNYASGAYLTIGRSYII